MKLYPRPIPQKHIKKKFLKHTIDKTIMIIPDPMYVGMPLETKPYTRIKSNYYTGLLTIKKASEIIKNILEKLKCSKILTKYDFGNDRQIIFIAEDLGIKCDVLEKKFKTIGVEKSSSLVVFASSEKTDVIQEWESYVNYFKEAKKPILIVDGYGVKRYIRSKQ